MIKWLDLGALFTPTEKTKLAGIETAATADQTGAEIKTAYEAEADTNAYTDAEKTKLTGIESSATADQTNTEIRDAVEAATDSNTFTDADHTKLNGVESGATADQTGAEIKTAYEAEANAYTDTKDTKLAGIEALADVTDATNVDTAGAVMESDIKDQSFTNLLENGDFESWSGGTAAVPDGWILSGAGSSIARSLTHKIGDYSAGITYGSADIFFSQLISDYARYAGRVVTFGIWVKSSAINQTYIQMYDSTTSSMSSYHTGGGGWEWLTVTHSVEASPGQLGARGRIFSAGTVYFDGAILVEGTVCPAFSPKPQSNFSLITAAPTDTGYDGEVRIYSTGGNRRIYVSDGTGWKYTAVAT